MRVRDVTVRPVYGNERSGIGMRHALFVVPYVLARVMARRQFDPGAVTTFTTR